MPESTIANTGNIGDKVQIYTFMRVREDDVSLYGFLTNEELRMFELLLSVGGIGAKRCIRNIIKHYTITICFSSHFQMMWQY